MSKNGSPIDESKWYMRYQGSGGERWREICNSVGIGLFIIQIDSLSLPNTSITINVTTGLLAEYRPLMSSSKNSSSSFFNNFHIKRRQWLHYFLSYCKSMYLGFITFLKLLTATNFRATLNGTSNLFGLSLIDSNSCEFYQRPYNAISVRYEHCSHD